MITKQERDNAMVIHLTSFAGYLIPFGSIIIPLILWQSQKKDSLFVDMHGKQSVNFNLSFLIYNTLLILLICFLGFGAFLTLVNPENNNSSEFTPEIFLGSSIIIGGIVLGGILFIIKIILTVIATTKAYDGKEYKYPLTINFIR